MRVEELEELWDLDNRGSGDDGDAESFGDGKGEAVGVRQCEVLDQGGVADGTKDLSCEVREGLREILGQRGEDGAESALEGFHGDVLCDDVEAKVWR